MKKIIKDFFYPSRKIFYTGYISLLILSIIFLRCNKTVQHRNALARYGDYFENYGFSYDSRFSDEDKISFVREDGSSIDLWMEYDGTQQFFKNGKYKLSYCDDSMFELIEGLTPNQEINTYRKQLEKIISAKEYEKNEGEPVWIERSGIAVYPENRDDGRDYSIVIFF